MSVRSTAERIRDAAALLASEPDCWVASANASGAVHLVPLSFSWDGAYITIATPRRSLTARNLLRTGWARIAIGPTRDVVIVEGQVTAVDLASDPALAETHAAVVGFDARNDPDPYTLLRIRAQRIQAWRNPAELTGRVIMQNGEWRTS